MNVADSEVVAAILTAAGFEHTTDKNEADVILVNTCSCLLYTSSEIYLDHRMEQSSLRQLGFRRYFQQPFQLESESGLGRSGLEHRIRMEFRLVRSLVRRLVRSLVSPLVRWLLSGMGLSTLASPTLGTSRLGLSALGWWKRSLSQQAQPASLGRTTAWIRRRSKRHTPCLLYTSY